MNAFWQTPAPGDASAHNPAEVFAAGERNHHISNTAYPIAHNVTWGPYRVGRENLGSRTIEAFASIDDLTLYSHIPFCETRCSFCEYTVVGQSELSRTEEYMNLLSRELSMMRALLGERRVHGFDIGGGTPGFVDAPAIAAHVEQARQSFRFSDGAGISIETTPRIAAHDLEKLQIYHGSGIDRISMGLQVIQPDLLRAIGRTGNGVEHHHLAAQNIRAAGFEKFNVDLMYGFAGQSLASWEATLDHAISLQPDYITLYRMRYKLTRISNQAQRVRMEDVKDQARMAREILCAAGYRANPGKNTYTRPARDTGTSAYLTRRVILGMPYLGLGLGAQTLSHTTIAYNAGAAGKNIEPYRRMIEAGELPIQDLYDLPIAHMMAKMIAVSFYFGEINLAAFEAKFGISLESAFGGAVSYALSQGLMQYTKTENGAEIGSLAPASLSLTPEGARHFNGTIALFFAPSVQEYLILRDPDQADDMHRNQRSAQLVAERNDA